MTVLSILLLLACAVAGIVLLDVAHASAFGAGSLVMHGWRIAPRFFALLGCSFFFWRLGRWTGGWRLRSYRPGDFAVGKPAPSAYAPTWFGRWCMLRYADSEEALSVLELDALDPFVRPYGVNFRELQKQSAFSAAKERAKMNGASLEELFEFDAKAERFC